MPLKKSKIKSAKAKKNNVMLIKQSAWKKRVFIIFGKDGDQQESCNGL